MCECSNNCFDDEHIDGLSMVYITRHICIYREMYKMWSIKTSCVLKWANVCTFIFFDHVLNHKHNSDVIPSMPGKSKEYLIITKYPIQRF